MSIRVCSHVIYPVTEIQPNMLVCIQNNRSKLLSLNITVGCHVTHLLSGWILGWISLRVNRPLAKIVMLSLQKSFNMRTYLSFCSWHTNIGSTGAVVETTSYLGSLQLNYSFCDRNHLWIFQIDDSELVQALIVFGCDVNGKNKFGHSPRHVAATGDGKNK